MSRKTPRTSANCVFVANIRLVVKVVLQHQKSTENRDEPVHPGYVTLHRARLVLGWVTVSQQVSDHFHIVTGQPVNSDPTNDVATIMINLHLQPPFVMLLIIRICYVMM